MFGIVMGAKRGHRCDWKSPHSGLQCDLCSGHAGLHETQGVEINDSHRDTEIGLPLPENDDCVVNIGGQDVKWTPVVAGDPTPLPSAECWQVNVTFDVEQALKQILDYAVSETGKSHKGYFGRGGWAYEVLAQHLGCIHYSRVDAEANLSIAATKLATKIADELRPDLKGVERVKYIDDAAEVIRKDREAERK